MADFIRTNPRNTRARQFAEQLLQTGAQTTPVRTPLAAIARAVQGLAGGFQSGQLAREQQTQEADIMAAVRAKLGDPSLTAEQQLSGAFGVPGVNPQVGTQFLVSQKQREVQAEQEASVFQAQAREKRRVAANVARSKTQEIKVGDKFVNIRPTFDEDFNPTGFEQVSEAGRGDVDLEKKIAGNITAARTRVEAAQVLANTRGGQKLATSLLPLNQAKSGAVQALEDFDDIVRNTTGIDPTTGRPTGKPKTPVGAAAAVSKAVGSTIGILADFGFDMTEATEGILPASAVPGTPENAALNDNDRNVQNLVYALAKLRKKGGRLNKDDRENAARSLKISGLTSSAEVIQSMPRIRKLFADEIGKIDSEIVKLEAAFAPAGQETPEQELQRLLEEEAAGLGE